MVCSTCCLANAGLIEQPGFSTLIGYSGVWGQSFTAPGSDTHLLLSVEIGALFTNEYATLLLFDQEFIGPYESLGSSLSGFIAEGMPDGLGGWSFATSTVTISGGRTYWAYYSNPTRSGFDSFFRYSDVDLYSGGSLYREDLNGVVFADTANDAQFSVITAAIPEPASVSVYLALFAGLTVTLRRRNHIMYNRK